jgi:hypothetical protein
LQPKTYMATEVQPDVARRFQQLCRSEDRSVSAGIRRLIGQYVEAVDGPMNGDGAAGNGAAHGTSTDAMQGRERVGTV